MKKWMILAVGLMTTGVYAQSPSYVDAHTTKIRTITSDWVEVYRYHANGQLMETGHLLFGEPHGEWLSYAEDGTRVCRAVFNHGLKMDTWEFVNPESTQMVRVRFEKNKPVGVMPLYVSID